MNTERIVSTGHDPVIRLDGVTMTYQGGPPPHCAPSEAETLK